MILGPSQIKTAIASKRLKYIKKKMLIRKNAQRNTCFLRNTGQASLLDQTAVQYNSWEKAAKISREAITAS